MRFYIVDDDRGVINILTRIIEENLGYEVIGTAVDGQSACQDLFVIQADIVLVDLLMPKISGNELVKKIKSVDKKIKFIMISQVTSIELREEAYEAGIEFFINKPINVIEVRKVIDQVVDKLELELKLSSIQKLVFPNKISQSLETISPTENNQLKKIKQILTTLGMIGEKGTQDILLICEILVKHKIHFSDLEFEKDLHFQQESKKIILQRIRRAIKIGLTNVANLGLDNYNDEVFFFYANSLFDFTNVRNEMNFIKGKASYGGKVSVNSFFEGLLQKSLEEN